MELQVSDSFLSTMGIPLLAGRDFVLADNENASKVIMINRTLAEMAFPKSNAVDQVLTDGNSDYRIVGVFEDIKYDNIRNDVRPMAFYPYRQHQVSSVVFEVRTELPPLTIVPAIQKVITDIDNNIGTPSFATQVSAINRTIEQERLFAWLSAAIASLAIFLSCIGLFGLMAYNIAQRTSEIGMRMALGATPRRVAWPILREALILAAIGVAIGTPATLALARVTQSIIYGIEPYDPATLVCAIIFLLVVAILAAWIPARRAAKIDPMVALRYE
jgi:predicted permease